MMAPKDHVLIAWAEGLSEFYDDVDYNGNVKQHKFVDSSYGANGVVREPEVVYWPQTQNLSVQYHPEYMAKDSPGWLYFNELINMFFVRGE